MDCEKEINLTIETEEEKYIKKIKIRKKESKKGLINYAISTNV